MNTFKKTGGFTLVELIIVIAILAILSSVAVAGYSSYITKANDSALNTFENDFEQHAVLANAAVGNVTVTFAYDVDKNTVTATCVAGNYFDEDFLDDLGYTFTAKKAYDSEGAEIAANDTTTPVAKYELTMTAPSALKGSSKG